MLEMRDHLLEQFEAPEQQHEAYRLGMWAFLASEAMLFGGLFLAYTVYRIAAFPAFAAASSHENLLLGSVNTAVLLASSLTMALAVDALERGDRRAAITMLVITAVLGVGFLSVKGMEYYEKFADHLVPGPGFHLEHATDLGHAQIFYFLYFAMTGLHALHLMIGVGVVCVMIALLSRGTEMVGRSIPVEMTALYWHLVDVVWVFLFPAFYLVGHVTR